VPVLSVKINNPQSTEQKSAATAAAAAASLWVRILRCDHGIDRFPQKKFRVPD
jgi:hypothetical protein